MPVPRGTRPHHDAAAPGHRGPSIVTGGLCWPAPPYRPPPPRPSRSRTRAGRPGQSPLRPSAAPLRVIAAGGMPGWQFTLIAVAGALVAATAAVFLDLAWASRQSASTRPRDGYWPQLTHNQGPGAAPGPARQSHGIDPPVCHPGTQIRAANALIRPQSVPTRTKASLRGCAEAQVARRDRLPGQPPSSAGGAGSASWRWAATRPPGHATKSDRTRAGRQTIRAASSTLRAA
jgi:hypothetical protein